MPVPWLGGPVPSLAMSAGWFPDPNDPNLSRYWDGSAWTASSRTGPPVAPVESPPTTPLPVAVSPPSGPPAVTSPPVAPPLGPPSTSSMPSHEKGRRRLGAGGIVLLATGVLVVLALGAGAAWWVLGREDRSVEAFCRTWNQEVAQLTGRIDLSTQGPIDALSGGLAAVEELPDALGRVERVAPDEIRPDVRDLRDAAQRLRDSTKDFGQDPLSAVSALGEAAVNNTAAALRVSRYVDTNCTGR